MIRDLLRRARLRRAHRAILQVLEDEDSDDLRAIREQVTLAFVEEIEADVMRAVELAELEAGPMSADPRWLRTLLSHLDDEKPGRHGAG